MLRDSLAARALVLAAVLSLACFAVPGVRAGEPLDDDTARAVRDYVGSVLDELGVPGAAVVIVRRDGIAFGEGFGMADGDGRAVTPQTPFHIASVSKQLTAIGVMQLIDDGALSLDAAVHDYVPWFGSEGSQTARITVRDLLAHTSGWTERDGLANRTDQSADEGALERNVRRLAEVAASHPIGEFEYSNANYDVLGYLISVAAGTSYEAYMQDHVLTPLGMANTHLSDADARAGDVAQGHYPFLGIPIAWDLAFVRGSLPSAYVAASAEDLGHVLIAHLNQGRYGDDEVLSPEALAELEQPLVEPSVGNGYGWGWWSYPLYDAGVLHTDADPPRYDAPIVLEHGGSHNTYASGMLLLREAGYGIVVLLNLNDEAAPSRFYQLHFGIAEILLGLEPPPLTQYDDLLGQYGKQLLAVTALLQLVGVAWALRLLRRWRRHPPTESRTLGWRIRHLVLPLALDLGVTVAAWWLVLDRARLGLTDIGVIVQLAPDVGLALILIALLGVGWGIVRTALTLGLGRPGTVAAA
jgi:CubicO group peptidase (beta-lactamase class C family)